jgi:hypothetical protein
VDISYHLQQGYECLVRADIPRGAEAIYWAREFPNFEPHPECDHIDVERNPAQAWHFPMFCKMGGSVYVAIQWAVKNGAEELYVIGCDLGIKPNSINHFHPKYIHVDSHGVKSAKLANENLEYSHKICSKECRQRGVEIYNAGIGGDLRVYPRVEFESLF